MQLIKAIRVKGVRSIREQYLSGISDSLAIVGKNSSGKSNLLRALNLFFNGEIEPGKGILFLRDHHEQNPRIRQRKVISVEVTFNVPDNFNFRSGIEHLESLGTEFTIERYWDLDQFRNPVEHWQVSSAEYEFEDQEDIARHFLGLIRYRYIPNRTIPSQLLQEESQYVVRAIFGRIKSDKHASALLSELTEAAGRLLSDAQESLLSTGSPLTKPTIATADSLGEMLSMKGFVAEGANRLPVQDEDWGSGHQAFFLFQLLKIIDTSYGSYFGWRQATIWGIEEPESGLHRDLETQLAGMLREWATATTNKMQIFITTHSPTFTMASASGVWVELKDAESIFETMSIPKLTQAADRKGVSSWVHPILYYPWNPVVLVEGAIDVEVLGFVANEMGLSHLRFVSLPMIDGNEKRGGKDKIIKFIDHSQGLIKNRPKTAPLLVMFDWDVSDQEIEKARKAYGEGGGKYVMKMDTSFADQRLGSSFKGIERFYPYAMFQELHNDDFIDLAEKKNGEFVIAKRDLDENKRDFAEYLIETVTVSKDLALAKVVLEMENTIQSEGPLQVDWVK